MPCRLQAVPEVLLEKENSKKKKKKKIYSIMGQKDAFRFLMNFIYVLISTVFEFSF